MLFLIIATVAAKCFDEPCPPERTEESLILLQLKSTEAHAHSEDDTPVSGQASMLETGEDLGGLEESDLENLAKVLDGVSKLKTTDGKKKGGKKLMDLITAAIVDKGGKVRSEPALPGFAKGGRKVPRILLGVDLWNPYVFIDPEDSGNMKGLLPEFIDLMQSTCTDIDVSWTHTQWGKCFSEPESGGSWVGDDIKIGAVHACAGYTHLSGVRNRIFEFSNAITQPSANTAGFITRLVDGVPAVSPTSDLSGVKVVDVAGWAPTADNIQAVKNDCTGDSFAYSEIEFVAAGGEGNAAAMAKLKSGEADAMWVYSDQAFHCQEALDTPDCAGWEGLGTDYAYIHTGMVSTPNGTTISISKRNAGVAALLDPCIQKAMETEAYKNLCGKLGLLSDCFPNSHFDMGSIPAKKHFDKPHSAKTAEEKAKRCADGYCSCSE